MKLNFDAGGPETHEAVQKTREGRATDVLKHEKLVQHLYLPSKLKFHAKY